MSDPIYSIPPTIVRPQKYANVESIPWHLAKQQMDQHWPYSNAGMDEIVAVIDTGIDQKHPAIKDTLVAVKDFTKSRRGVDDLHGHGTHVAGTIVGAGTGTAPKAKLVVCKALSDDGFGQDSWIAKAIDYAIQQKASVINMSLGSPSPSARILEMCQAAFDAGIVVVAATGNDANTRISYPAGFNQCVLAVGAIDSRNNRANFSNFDSRELSVDLVDYGVDILSCVPGGRYSYMSGTSMATPCVSGKVLNRFSNERIVGRRQTGDPLARYQLIPKMTIDLGRADWDNEYGMGLLDPDRTFGKNAVRLDIDGPGRLPLPDDPGSQDDPEADSVLGTIEMRDGRPVVINSKGETLEL